LATDASGEAHNIQSTCDSLSLTGVSSMHLGVAPHWDNTNTCLLAQGYGSVSLLIWNSTSSWGTQAAWRPAADSLQVAAQLACRACLVMSVRLIKLQLASIMITWRA